MRRRALIPNTLAAPLLLALALVIPASALAGADPPSDILLKDDYYLPYALTGDDLSPVKVPAQARELEQALAAARDRKRAFKVAVIGSEVDLGGVPELFTGPPQRYADFLYGEIGPALVKTDATLLVVTPRGAAVAGPQATDAARSALAGRRIPADPSPAVLAQAAVDGVRAVAAANGHPLPSGAAGEDDGGPWWMLGVLAFALLAAGALALRLRVSRPSE